MRGIKKPLLAFALSAVLFVQGASSVYPVYADEDEAADTTSEEAAPETVIIRVNTNSDLKEISPYIYGADMSSDLSGVSIKSIYMGGEEYTAYDWESNYSNSGNAGGNKNGTLLVPEKYLLDTPAYSAGKLVESAAKNGVGYTVAMLQNGEYVAAGGYSGGVQAPTPESYSGWNRLSFRKNSSFALDPDKNDGFTYIDEYVNYLVSKYGKANTTTGIKGYTFGSNSDKIYNDFNYIRNTQYSCREVIDRSIEFGRAIKSVDPTAEVYGPSLSGLEAIYRPDAMSEWSTASISYRWFLDYYLAGLKSASSESRQRLLDVLDLHYMAENSTDECVGVWECDDITHEECNEKRIQAPRTLWDSTFKESGKIGENYRYFLPVIPTVQASINEYYPGTKLSFSEYSFGGGNHISGGLAVADALGIFADNEVYMASLSDLGRNDLYAKAAINLYTNYDGLGSGFGRYAVNSTCSNNELASVHAAVSDSGASALRIVLINKSDRECNMNVYVNTDTVFTSLSSYYFDETTSDIVEGKGISELMSANFGYSVQPHSAVMVVLTSEEGSETMVTTPEPEVPTVTESTDTPEVTEQPVVSEITEITPEVTTVITEASEIDIPPVTTPTEVVTTTPEESSAIEVPPGDRNKTTPTVLKGIAVFLVIILAAGIVFLFRPEWSRLRSKKANKKKKP